MHNNHKKLQMTQNNKPGPKLSKWDAKQPKTGQLQKEKTRNGHNTVKNRL